jgi:glycolate oxidase FAD binding subunit
MVGSLGRLGVLSELTFKVFPLPHHRVTLQLECQDLADAIRLMCQLAGGPWELEAIDLEPPGGLILRLAGEQDAVTDRAQRIMQSVGRGGQIMTQAAAYWNQVDRFGWAAEGLLVKAPITPKRIETLDPCLAAADAQRRYSVAGNVAWIAWPADRALAELDDILRRAGLSGLVIRGPAERVRLGVDGARAFVDRIKRALDPDGRFGAL